MAGFFVVGFFGFVFLYISTKYSPASKIGRKHFWSWSNSFLLIHRTERACFCSWVSFNYFLFVCVFFLHHQTDSAVDPNLPQVQGPVDCRKTLKFIADTSYSAKTTSLLNPPLPEKLIHFWHNLYPSVPQGTFWNHQSTTSFPQYRKHFGPTLFGLPFPPHVTLRSSTHSSGLCHSRKHWDSSQRQGYQGSVKTPVWAEHKHTRKQWLSHGAWQTKIHLKMKSSRYCPNHTLWTNTFEHLKHQTTKENEMNTQSSLIETNKSFWRSHFLQKQ